VLELFCEVFGAPIFDSLEIEKNIVREEILEGLDDAGNEIDPDALVRRLAYGDSALGRPITGSIDRVEAMTRAELDAHHRKLYVGDNTIVTVAGPVDPARVLALARQHFKSLPRGAVLHPEPAPVIAAKGARFQYTRHPSSQTQLQIAFHAPGEHSVLEPATDLLLRVLDDGMSTRLYHQIVDERGLCYDVSAAYEAYSDSGLFDISAESDHERAPEVLSEVLRLLFDLAEHGPTDAELDKAKTRYRFQLAELVDHPEEVAEFFGFGCLTGVARTPAARWERLSSLSRSQVRDAASHLFRADALHVVGVGGAKKRQQDALQSLTLG
jgi:predicted Zn-dependent peptidase